MSLLKNEQQAKDFVESIGQTRTRRLLDLITNRIARRIVKANEGCSGLVITESSVRRADWEVELIHKLKMGMMLTDTYNTQSAAKARNIKRIADRRAKRAQARAAIAA
jgi:hypothetical protein